MKTFRIVAACPSAVVVFAISVTFAALVVAADSAKKSDLRGQTKEDFLDVFLTETELTGMQMRGDFRVPEVQPDGSQFPEVGELGERYGRANWVEKEDSEGKALTERLEDHRWCFPTAEAAHDFFVQNAESEAGPDEPVKNPPKIGDECVMHGGQAGFGDFVIRQYTCVFRTGNTVTKILTVDSRPKSSLNQVTLTALCQKAAKRIKGEEAKSEKPAKSRVRR